MNELIEAIINTNKSKKELIASTVRISIEANSFIEELSEQSSKTKQDVFKSLIETGIEVIKKELDLLEVEKKIVGNFHLLNTNKGNNLVDHENMLKDGTASAFYNHRKLNIERIKENDIVFLYENGIGIVAYGKGTGKTLKKDHNGNKDEWYYQELKDFKRLQKPISAKEIKKIDDIKIIFLRTMSTISNGKKILDLIESK